MTIKRLGVDRCWVDGQWIHGDVALSADGVVERVGIATDRSTGRAAVPGFIDVQVNGFAGVSFSGCDQAGFADAQLAMARTGVTSYLITIPTNHPDRYTTILTEASAAIAATGPWARPIGVHLEGPFLTRPGAHRADWLRDPDEVSAAALLRMAPISLMTLAPEAPGAIDVIRSLRRAGVVVSLGHSNGTAAEAHAAFDAGATAVTHLWNAQTPMTSREPGVAGAALSRDDVSVCMIADLIHLHPDTVRVSMRAAGRRAVVVTDASPFAATAPGSVRYEGVTVHPDGSVRLADGTLSGSAVALDEALRRMVSIGVDLEAALRAITTAPARMLNRTDLGQLQPGRAGDVVILDDHLAVVDVLIGGRLI